MPNKLWVTGDDVRMVIDDNNTTSNETFIVQDRGNSRRVITVSEEGWTMVGGAIERANGNFLLASDGTDPAIQFQTGGTPTTVAELSSTGRLDLSLGSVGGVRLGTSQQANRFTGRSLLDRH